MKQRSKSKSFSIQTLILRIVIVWAIVAFVIYPNLNLLVSVFYKNGQFSTDVFGKVFGSARAMKSLVNSFILAFTLVVTVNIVGTLSVLLTEYWDIKGAIFAIPVFCRRSAPAVIGSAAPANTLWSLPYPVLLNAFARRMPF